jgi:hypothetical protein
VVLTVASGDTGEATASPATLTFTPANWNTAQTVTVAGVNDDLADGPQTTLVTVAVNDGASDNAYDNVADQTVSVTTADNDTAGFTITQSGGTTSVSENLTTDILPIVRELEADLARKNGTELDLSQAPVAAEAVAV